MEWSKSEQILFLFQSAIVGMLIGAVFDWLSGWYRERRYRKKLFFADILFGAVSAIGTFFGALVIMDGQLHPLLFFGGLLGLLMEHYVMGKWASRYVSKVHFGLRQFRRFLTSLASLVLVRIKGKAADFYRNESLNT